MANEKKTCQILEDIRPPKFALNFHTVLAADFSPLRFYTVRRGCDESVITELLVFFFFSLPRSDGDNVNCLPFSAHMTMFRRKHFLKKKNLNKGSDKVKTASVHLGSLSGCLDAHSNESSPLFCKTACTLASYALPSAAFCATSFFTHLKNGYPPPKKKNVKKEIALSFCLPAISAAT